MTGRIKMGLLWHHEDLAMTTTPIHNYPFPVINKDMMIGKPTIRFGSWQETINDVKITYTNMVESEMYGGEGDYADGKEGVVFDDDLANKEFVGRIRHKSQRMAMYVHTPCAQWGASRLLLALCFPSFEAEFDVKRDLFRLEPGDNYVLHYAPYELSGIVMRILEVTDGNLEKENITVSSARDPLYHGYRVSAGDSPTGTPPTYPDSYTVMPIEFSNVVESPYMISGDNIRLLSMAARVTGFERGYSFYLSTDGGSSYVNKGFSTQYNPHGRLAFDYTGSRDTIDQNGFTVDASYDADWDVVQSITETQLYAGNNQALLGDEIISFQTITPDPVISGRYHITGVWGGRFDTDIEYHGAGADFFFLDVGTPATFGDSQLVVDASVYIKLIPYTDTGSGSLAEAVAQSLTITGRAVSPYPIANLRANDELYSESPGYSDDVVLTWDARIRGSGAGSQYPVAPDDPDTWEGYFQVEVVVGGSVVRTVTDIDAQTWTYTEAMSLSDNGSLPSSVRFQVVNYVEDTGTGLNYDSPVTIIDVTLSI